LSRRRLEPRPTIGARDLRDGRPARFLDTLSSRRHATRNFHSATPEFEAPPGLGNFRRCRPSNDPATVSMRDGNGAIPGAVACR
jgi:hypothetical protein